MTWYKTGTVSVTNGSPNVTLASGNAQLNIFPDDGFVGPDGRTYAILQVNSATQFVLSQNYKGATVSGQDYVIIPTADHIQLRDMLVGVNDLIDRFETISLEAGAGRFQNGTALEPGVRGVTNPDTGLVWDASGFLNISVNGTIVATFNASGLNGAITGATFTAAHQILISTAANTPSIATIDTNSIVGRAASGNIKGLTPSETLGILGITVNPANIVGTTNTQTLTNKTISFSSNTIQGTLPLARGGTGVSAASNSALLSSLGAAALTDFAATLDSVGRVRLPNNLLFQWGEFTANATVGGPVTITFPVAYVAPPYILGGFAATGSTSVASVWVGDWGSGPSGILRCNHGGIGCRYFALGRIA